MVRTVLLLTASHVFMTFAWYAHLRNLSDRRGHRRDRQLGHRALRVPAAGTGHRIGYQTASLAQLQIIQEVITLGVFVPFAILYMRQPVSWTFVWAGCCLMGAVYSCSSDESGAAELEDEFDIGAGPAAPAAKGRAARGVAPAGPRPSAGRRSECSRI